MADPVTTILEYATQRSEATNEAVSGAQQRLAKAQTDITAKRGELASATGDFADLEKRAAEIRKKLAVIPTPVDGPKLLDDLEQVIIGARARQAAILKAGIDLRAAESDTDQARAELAAASASRGKADSNLLQAKQSDSLRNGWKKALADEPLATIRDGAVHALEAGLFKAAEERVMADLTPSLFTHATARREGEALRLAGARASAQIAEDRLLAEREKTVAAGKIESTLILLLRAEAAARDFVNNAKSRYDQAQTLLTQVADESRSRLTPEQAAALTDTILKDARVDAAAAEKALDDLRKKVEDRQTALDQAKLDAVVTKTPENETAVENAAGLVALANAEFTAADRAWRTKFQGLEKLRELKTSVEAKQAALTEATTNANNNPADAALEQARKDAEKALETAQAQLRIGEASYKHSLLDAWEAAAPDTTWRLLDDFEKAKAVLTVLSASDPVQACNGSH